MTSHRDVQRQPPKPAQSPTLMGADTHRHLMNLAAVQPDQTEANRLYTLASELAALTGALHAGAGQQDLLGLVWTWREPGDRGAEEQLGRETCADQLESMLAGLALSANNQPLALLIRKQEQWALDGWTADIDDRLGLEDLIAQASAQLTDNQTPTGSPSDDALATAAALLMNELSRRQRKRASRLLELTDLLRQPGYGSAPVDLGDPDNAKPDPSDI